MEHDELIIWVYLWVCEQMAPIKANCRAGRLRRGGFAPALSDEEALTIELCGEMFRLHSDKALFHFFKTYYRDWFPHLRDRPAFVRQIANLFRVKTQLNQRLLAQHFVQEQRIQPIDTMPLPVCAKVRARRDRCFAGLAHKSFCAAKDLFYYGFKLGLRVTQTGFISCAVLLQANTHDCRHLETLVEGHQGWVPVDKGFFDPALWRSLFKRGIHMVGHGPERIEHRRPAEVALPDWVERTCARIRKTVEVVAGLLWSRFGVDRIRVHDLWHFQHRLGRKILAFNLLVALNLLVRRPPLDFDGLLHD